MATKPITEDDLRAIRDLAQDISADEQDWARRLEHDLRGTLPDTAATAQAVNSAILRLCDIQRGLLFRLALAEQEAELRARLSKEV